MSALSGDRRRVGMRFSRVCTCVCGGGLRGRRCRANRWDVASASAHVGRATAAEAGQPSDVAAPRVGPRLLLHVRQKSMWRIDRGARET